MDFLQKTPSNGPLSIAMLHTFSRATDPNVRGCARLSIDCGATGSGPKVRPCGDAPRVVRTQRDTGCHSPTWRFGSAPRRAARGRGLNTRSVGPRSRDRRGSPARYSCGRGPRAAPGLASRRGVRRTEALGTVGGSRGLLRNEANSGVRSSTKRSQLGVRSSTKRSQLGGRGFCETKPTRGPEFCETKPTRGPEFYETKPTRGSGGFAKRSQLGVRRF